MAEKDSCVIIGRCADYIPVSYTHLLLASAGWRYGIACAAALAAAVAGALAWLWRTAMRTRSSIGRLCAVGCCALLTMHGVLNLLSCLGWSSARGMLPFLDGGWTGVMQAGLAGDVYKRQGHGRQQLAGKLSRLSGVLSQLGLQRWTFG